MNQTGSGERDAGRASSAKHYQQMAAEALDHGARLQEWAMSSADLPVPL